MYLIVLCLILQVSGSVGNLVAPDAYRLSWSNWLLFALVVNFFRFSAIVLLRVLMIDLFVLCYSENH